MDNSEYLCTFITAESNPEKLEAIAFYESKGFRYYHEGIPIDSYEVEPAEGQIWKKGGATFALVKVVKMFHLVEVDLEPKDDDFRHSAEACLFDNGGDFKYLGTTEKLLS